MKNEINDELEMLTAETTYKGHKIFGGAKVFDGMGNLCTFWVLIGGVRVFCQSIESAKELID